MNKSTKKSQSIEVIEDDMNFQKRNFKEITKQNCQVLGCKGNEPRQFDGPYGICIDNTNGDYYVSEFALKNLNLFIFILRE